MIFHGRTKSGRTRSPKMVRCFLPLPGRSGKFVWAEGTFNMGRIFSGFVAVLLGIRLLGAQSPPKIKVLILTGENNHDWLTSTRILRDMLEQTGRFEVRVNEEVRGNGPETFAPYDVLLLNWNDSHFRAGPWWDARPREALLDFVRNGKGLVSYHCANCAFWGWEEYDKLIGGVWRETGGHGPYHDFTVKIVDPDDPITRGLPATFAESDQVYHGLKLQPNIHILATAWDDPQNCSKDGKSCGTGKDEPQIWTLQYGTGRVFQNSLGHDEKSMSTQGFRTTLARGTEWAATGQVTLPVQPDAH